MRQVLACMGSLRLDPQFGPALIAHGVNLSLAATDRECLHQLRELLPEAVLLGVPLAPLQTARKCAEFHRETGAGLLAVSSSYSQRQAVAALEAGADDYLVLADNYEELGARLRALLRRSARVSEQRNFNLGDLRIDAESRTVRVHDREAQLTPLEFRLLSCLAANPGKSLSPGTLLQAVQGYDLNEQDASHIIKALVWRLRQKIELDPAHPVYVHKFEAPATYSNGGARRSRRQLRPSNCSRYPDGTGQRGILARKIPARPSASERRRLVTFPPELSVQPATRTMHDRSAQVIDAGVTL